MKYKSGIYLLLAPIILIGTFDYLSAQTKNKLPEYVYPDKLEKKVSRDDPASRSKLDWLRYHDPATGEIPLHIHSRELEFASHLPKRQNGIYSVTSDPTTVESINWNKRGPINIGGRTRAFGIDINNENIFLAGAVSGGIWRSVNQGKSWTRTTPVNGQNEISCLTQDIRPGKTNIWYAGTGEISYSSQDCIGNGILKSIDNGLTWNELPSTVSDNKVDMIQPFDFIQNIAIDPSLRSQDIIYAAVVGGIERSSDGGSTWNMVLGDFTSGSYYTDVTVSSQGVIYAAMSYNTKDGNASNWNGIYRSTDGLQWTNITPDDWQDNTGVISLGLAPSNENILYTLCNVPGPDYTVSPHYFLKYTYNSGDGSGNGGTWDDRSANMPVTISGDPFVSYNGYALYVKVKPDDENVIFIGGMYCYRSDDALSSSDMITDLSSNYDIHPDQHALVFFHSDPRSMIAGNDGGIFLTTDNSSNWTSLNNNYLTTQFYTVALDHATSGNNTVIGGMQDNSTIFTNSADESNPWNFLFGGDGMTCAIASSRSSYYVSYQYGYSERQIIDDGGNILESTRIDPEGGAGDLWTDPFVLDPNNTNTMYYGGGTDLWRNKDLTVIPLSSYYPATEGWEELPSTTILNSNSGISAIGISQNPADRVYYGTTDGQIYRLDNSSSADHTPKSIWRSKGFPSQAHVSCIAVDPNNGDNAIVVFSNYDIQSLFYTTNAGSTWKTIGGNLEEHSDGSGNGPSCRWVSILPLSNGTLYLVATSTGVYSTSQLNGGSTIWSLEGVSTMGNCVADMIDVRASDGQIVIGTHGAGIFSGTITSLSKSVHSANDLDNEFSLEQNYPNPATNSTIFKYHIALEGFVTFEIYDMVGQKVTTLVSEDLEPGTYSVSCRTNTFSSGIYTARLTSGEHSISKQMIVLR